MSDSRTDYLNLYEIGASSDNIGVHMISHYNYNMNQLDTFIATHDINGITVSNGILTLTSSNSTTYTCDLNTMLTGFVADYFDSTASYAVGDYCVYLGVLYECTTAHSGDWDASDFTATTLIEAIAASGVTSFNGRTGAVTPAASDYDASDIDYDNTSSGLSATDAQDAIDELASDKADTSALTDGSVTKVGTSTVGSTTQPIYLNSGTPTAMSGALSTAYGGTGNTSVDSAPTSGSSKMVTSDGISAAIEDVKCLVVSASSISSLSATITDSSITSTMVCINSYLSNPAAQTGTWTITTASGYATISGSISGTTNITLYLVEQM